MKNRVLIALLSGIGVAVALSLPAAASAFKDCTFPMKHLKRKSNEDFVAHSNRIVAQCDRALTREKDNQRLTEIHNARGGQFWFQAVQFKKESAPEQRRKMMKKALEAYESALRHDPLDYNAILRKTSALEEAHGTAAAQNYRIERAVLASVGILAKPPKGYFFADHAYWIKELHAAPLTPAQVDTLIAGYTDMILRPPEGRETNAPYVYVYRGEANLFAGKNRSAQTDFATALEILPSRSQEKEFGARAHLGSAIAQWRLGEANSARNHFSKTLAIFERDGSSRSGVGPQAIVTLNNLAKLLRKKDYYKSKYQEINQAAVPDFRIALWRCIEDSSCRY